MKTFSPPTKHGQRWEERFRGHSAGNIELELSGRRKRALNCSGEIAHCRLNYSANSPPCITMASSGGSSNIQISEARPVSETASSCCRGSRGFLDLLTADLTSPLTFLRWRWRLTGIRDPAVDLLTTTGWVGL